ncbi:MAG: hypothetical protein IJ773_00820 [Lachnospiraceae bacterium]|nr:hypothetical protein [Lachnospiraceae bacterium]
MGGPRKRQYLSGSYTVEAAFVLPIVLLSLCLCLRLGFALEQTAGREAAAEEEQLLVQDQVDTCLIYVRMMGMLKEVIK